MGSNALHRIRRHSRRLAAAAVAVFALNWLGLALMPCAMAYALPEAPAAQQQAAADAALPGCPGHAGVVTPQDAPSAEGEPCPWCLEAGTTGGDHDAGCGAVPKPALDSRDAKNPVAPLLVALSAAVLGVVPLEASAPSFAPARDVLPPAMPAVDRYCRRLE
jgi:hypothetical protein